MGSPNYGVQSGIDCTFNYAGSRRTINATINADELQRGLAKQRADAHEAILKNETVTRVKKGKRVVTHQLPLEETYPDKDTVKVSRPTTQTTRIEH